MVNKSASTRAVMALMLWLGTVAVWAQQAGCVQAESELAAGRQEHAQHNYQAAISDFRDATKLCPGNHQALLETMQSELAAGQPAAAEKDARQYMKLEPNSETGQFFLAFSLYQQHRYPESAHAAMAVVQKAPRDAKGYVLLGMSELFMNNFPQSERALKDGLKLEPNNREALYFLALGEMGQDRFSTAASTLRRLLEEDPNSYQAHDKLGVCKHRMAKFEEAAAEFRKSERLAPANDPGSDAPFADHTAMLLDEKKPEAAIAVAREAVRRNPQSATDQFFLGRAWFEAGKFQEAIAPLEKVVTISPKDRKAHFLLARAQQQLGNKEAAAREFAVVRQLEAEGNDSATEKKQGPHAGAQGPSQ